jgi:cytidylate kinase
MWNNIGYGKCEFFIECYFDSKKKDASETFIKPAITISRTEGAGGHTVASNLSEYMQTHTSSHDVWTVFDRNLAEKVMEDHNLQKRVADFMKEDHKGMLSDAVEEWLGFHPSTWTLVEKINATILRLAQIGNVILVGRGGSIVTNDLQNVFRVRLVGSIEKRVEQIQKVYNLDQKAALDFIKKEDKGSKRYVKDNFDKDIDDPLLYHITINTDMVQYDEAARLIGDEVIKRFKLDKPVKAAVSRSSLI